MQQVFESLSRGIEGAPGVALGAAVLWGVLSIVLSPCHLASIPLIVGFISGDADRSVGRAYALSGMFSLGILLTIAAIGGITAAAGTMLGNVGPWSNYLVAVVFFAMGLHLMGAISLPMPSPANANTTSRGLGAALTLGAVFGLALGPCTFAFMVPVLTATLKVAAGAPALAAGLLLAYGVGHCAVIVLAGGSVQATQRVLNWSAGSKQAEALKQVCAFLVILGGLYLLWTAA